MENHYLLQDIFAFIPTVSEKTPKFRQKVSIIKYELHVIIMITKRYASKVF